RSFRGAHGTLPSGVDQPGIPERRGVDGIVPRPALPPAGRAGQVLFLSRFYTGHRRAVTRARPARAARRLARLARSAGGTAGQLGAAERGVARLAGGRAPIHVVLLSARAGAGAGRFPGQRRAAGAAARPRGRRPGAVQRPIRLPADRPRAFFAATGLRPPALARTRQLRARRGLVRAGAVGRAAHGLAYLPPG